MCGSSRFRERCSRTKAPSYRLQVDTYVYTWIDDAYRESRYMGGVMRVQVKKWGNSASVRIPASIMAATAFHIDQEVDVREEDGRNFIDPLMRSYDAVSAVACHMEIAIPRFALRRVPTSSCQIVASPCANARTTARSLDCAPNLSDAFRR